MWRVQLHPRRSFLYAICHRDRGKLCHYVINNIQERLTSNTPAMPVLRLLTTGFSVNKIQFPLKLWYLVFSWKQISSIMFIQKPYLQLKEIATFETLHLLRKTLKMVTKISKPARAPKHKELLWLQAEKAELSTLPKTFCITSGIFQLYFLIASVL